MRTIFTQHVWRIVIAAPLVALATGCGGGSGPATDTAAAEVTAAWTKAFNAGDAAALARLYAEDGRTMPPNGGAIAGRGDIEAFWRDDMGEGGATTTLTPGTTLAAGDFVHVEGTYQVSGRAGVELAQGQYQQLWSRAGDTWQIRREIWRTDPALHREIKVADGLTSAWTSAYNAGDAAKLVALYADDAALSTVREGTVNGKQAIESFWMRDLAGAKPASRLTLTDVYIAGDIAHLEGDYDVKEGGSLTEGRYIQLWMRDNGDWRIHREMWWR